MSRMARNPAYSLRAFARQLNINHATLSAMLSGRRRITKAMVDRLGKAMGLSPASIEDYTARPERMSYVKLQEDVFASLSTWYLDAILELTLIAKFKMEPRSVSRVLDISVVEATAALETLMRLELLEKLGSRYRKKKGSTSTVLGKDYTTSAQKLLQKAILQKSIEAVDSIARPQRDHTSIAMAIDTHDLPELREMITAFRRELDRFAQRDGFVPDRVYQLQISFFPLSHMEGEDDVE